MRTDVSRSSPTWIPSNSSAFEDTVAVLWLAPGPTGSLNGKMSDVWSVFSVREVGFSSCC